MDFKALNKVKNIKNKIDFADHGIVYALLIFFVILICTNSNFRNFIYYQNILRQASFYAICGVAMTFAIITGDLDLSVASQVAVSSVIFTLIIPKLGLLLSILVISCVGSLMGLINGLLIAKLKIPAFIATLGTQLGFRALAQLINEVPVVVHNQTLADIAFKNFLGLPIPFYIMALIAIVGTLLLRKTVFGRSVLAIGNSKEAAKISGINVDRTQILTYVVLGLFTAFSAIMFTAYLGSSNYGMQKGLEFTVISAVVLGGTALKGGKGSIFNTIVAAIFLMTIQSALDAFRIQSYVQRIIEGAILVVAFSITEIREQINKFKIKRQVKLQAAKKASQ